MSISSAVVSFFSYFQNLSVNIKLPHIEFPSWFTELLESINDFIAKIQAYLLEIPPFDMRTQLVLMSVIIPLLLDILFVWFVQPFLLTLFDILDIASMFVILFLCAYGYIVHWSLAVKILIAVFAIYLLVRIFLSLKNDTISYQMIKLARDICSHYLIGILPEIKTEYSLDDLNKALQRFSKLVEIKPQPPKMYITINFLIVSVITILVSLFFFNIFPFLAAPLSKQLNTIFGIIFIVIGFICFLVFVLRLFQCGRNFIMKFKQFLKRWGLRLLMLCFDLLYIPIATLLISHINVKKYSPCPSGQYLYQEPDKYNNTLSHLIIHKTQCLPCNVSKNSSVYDRCLSICSGIAKYRPVDDPTLEFMKDIIEYSGGFIVCAFFFVIIGIPILWFVVIQRNRDFSFVINVYGDNPTIKWTRIVNRMKTTGIFLFVNYKYNNSRWSVLYLLVKFLVMILSTIASRFYRYLSISLSILYLFIFLCVVIVRPYLYFVNNLLDSILYFTQFLFSLNTSLAIFNIRIPPIASTILSMIAVVIPVISMVFLLFFKRKQADFENDPTYPQNLTDEEEEKLNRKRQIAKKKYLQKLREKEQNEEDEYEYSYNEEEQQQQEEEEIVDAFVINEEEEELVDIETNRPNSIEDVNQPLLETNKKEKRKKEKKEKNPTIQLQELDENENICFIPEDEYEVKPGELGNLNQAIIRLKKSKNRKVEPGDAEETFIVNRRVLANRMTDMYKMLDVAVDGFTISLLTKVLSIAICCGMGSLGWYVGSIHAHGVQRQPVCHVV